MNNDLYIRILSINGEVSFGSEQAVVDRVVVHREQYLELGPVFSCLLLLFLSFQRILCHHLFLNHPISFLVVTFLLIPNTSLILFLSLLFPFGQRPSFDAFPFFRENFAFEASPAM